ncbi:5380_t:CDS:2, partial [Diversispora eburnea]
GGIPEMPQVSSVCDIDIECERALASACIKTKEGKVNIDDKKIAEALISFVARELPKATRVWIIGKDILTHEGILYRSSHECEKLIKAFEYEKSQFIPEELLKWGAIDIRGWMEGGYYPSTAPIPSQELKTEYNELEKFLGGAQSYRFRCWREREIESMVWNAPIDPVPKHIHIDLRGAYLGCEDSEQKRIQRHACVENIEAVRCLTGVVQLVAWEFAKNLHPFTAGLIGAGWLISATPREIIYSVGKKSHIEFPPSRDLAVRFVGSCVRNAQVTSVLIRDKNEADMIHQWLARKKCRPNRITIPETILDESKLEIDFDKELFANAKNDIELEEVHKRYDAEKKPGYIYRKEASSWTINYKSSLDFPPSEAPPLSTDPKLITLRKPYLVDQGGSGKTTRAIRAFSNRKIVVLTPANLLAEYHRKQNPGLTAMTYHKYFHLGATPIDEWDPACLEKKTLAEILIFDEACMIPRKVLQRLLSYAESRGCQIIMCGDPGQLTPWGDKEGPHKFLTEWADKVIWCMEDYQFHKAIPKTSWENALAQWTPNDIWICSTNGMGMRVESALLQAHASHFFNKPSVIRFDPDDSIKHKYRIQGKPVQIPGSIEIIEAYVGTIVNVPLEIVLRGLPAEWKYAGWEMVHRIQGQTIEAPECCFIVDHSLRGWINNAVYTACSHVRYMNQLIRVAPPNDILEYIELTELQVTSCPQIIEAKLRRYKLDDRKKNRHFSRPLMIVEDWEIDNKSDLMEDSTVCEKSLFLAENDEENAIPSLTVKDVIEITTWQDKCCKVCRVPLLFQGYSNHHPQSFSVDRLDDAEGHYRQNVRITCLRCNERHRH